MDSSSDRAARELLWLRRIRDLSQALASETEQEALVPRVLDAAIELTGAERGTLARLERTPEGKRKIRVLAMRGFESGSLAGAGGEVSRTAVERVMREDRGLVSAAEADRDVMDASSMMNRTVRSLACFPLRLRGRLMGVLYLDHSRADDAFTEADLPILESFAGQAALALESTERAAPAPVDALAAAGPTLQLLEPEVERASRCWDSVLILGEPGTELEAVARAIHAASDRANEPFVQLSCRRDAPDLAAALLGEDGALARAGRGTLCLAAVEELDRPLQNQLVRILTDRQYTPPGTSRHESASCRVIALCGVGLRERVDQGEFLPELYYRLDVLRLIVPPLRQRVEDLDAQIAHLCAVHSLSSFTLSDKALSLMQAYSWPGNHRELENEVRRLASLGERRISGNHLSPEIREGRGIAGLPHDFAGKTLGEVEEELVRRAYADCGGNKARTARKLGVPRSTLYHLLARYGLS